VPSLTPTSVLKRLQQVIDNNLTEIDSMAASTGTFHLYRPKCYTDDRVLGAKFKFERIDKDNVMLLVVDHQVGLFQLVRDYQPDEYRNNILAHAALGKVFNLPTVLTTSAETGS
jgi:hypothetical protein